MDDRYHNNMSTDEASLPKIGLLGFGEAARTFTAGWRSSDAQGRTASIVAYDIKIEQASQHNALIDGCAGLGVSCAVSPAQAIAGRSVVFSLVTADRALEAAREAAAHLDADVLYLDCNSCSPSLKKAASEVIAAAGGRYVDVAVMSPVNPARHRTPLLLSGPFAAETEKILKCLDMKASIAGEHVGDASSIKMLRSVMIKGFEALTAECLLAARKAGVEKQVLASLQASDPGMDWTARGAYNLERMIVHGRRRAAEMNEVAKTLAELGLPDRMASATAAWQSEIGELEVEPEGDDLENRADAILRSFAT